MYLVTFIWLTQRQLALFHNRTIFRSVGRCLGNCWNSICTRHSIFLSSFLSFEFGWRKFGVCFIESTWSCRVIPYQSTFFFTSGSTIDANCDNTSIIYRKFIYIRRVMPPAMCCVWIGRGLRCEFFFLITLSLMQFWSWRLLASFLSPLCDHALRRNCLAIKIINIWSRKSEFGTNANNRANDFGLLFSSDFFDEILFISKFINVKHFLLREKKEEDQNVSFLRFV